MITTTTISSIENYDDEKFSEIRYLVRIRSQNEDSENQERYLLVLKNNNKMRWIVTNQEEYSYDEETGESISESVTDAIARSIRTELNGSIDELFYSRLSKDERVIEKLKENVMYAEEDYQNARPADKEFFSDNLEREQQKLNDYLDPSRLTGIEKIALYVRYNSNFNAFSENGLKILNVIVNVDCQDVITSSDIFEEDVFEILETNDGVEITCLEILAKFHKSFVDRSKDIGDKSQGVNNIFFPTTLDLSDLIVKRSEDKRIIDSDDANNVVNSNARFDFTSNIDIGDNFKLMMDTLNSGVDDYKLCPISYSKYQALDSDFSIGFASVLEDFEIIDEQSFDN